MLGREIGATVGYNRQQAIVHVAPERDGGYAPIMRRPPFPSSFDLPSISPFDLGVNGEFALNILLWRLPSLQSLRVCGS
jgi:hypothetical protein